MKVVTILVLLIALVIVFGCSSDSAVSPELLIDYSTNPEGQDNITRGFYIESYPGSTLDEITLWFSPNTTGDHVIQMEVRENTYDGDLVGTDTVTLTLTSDYTPATFEFNNAPVTPGAVVTFAMSRLSGPGFIPFYAYDCDEFDTMTPAQINAIMTGGTSPPLSTFRRDGVAMMVYGRP